MAMVCTQCNTSHDQRLQCPTCGGRLVYREQRNGPACGARARGYWLQSYFGRITIGLVLAQGLYWSLRHLLTSFLLISQGEEELPALLVSWNGLLVLESLQLLPLLVAGMLGGAGQKHAFILGFLIGLCNSGLCMLLAAFFTHQPSSLSWYGQPLLQGLFGSVGAWTGCMIWKPLVVSTLPTGAGPFRKIAGRRGRSLLAGRIAWFRIGLGVLLTVAGVLWAESLFQSVLRASGGSLETASSQQDQIFTWEVKVLAMLFGGALAGATTPNGFKQGLVVGIIAGMILLLIPNSRATLLVSILSLFSTFTLSMAGGWFGNQLLPPVIPRSSQRKTVAAY